MVSSSSSSSSPIFVIILILGVPRQDYTIDIFFRQWWTDDRLAHGYNKVFTMANDLTDRFWTPDTYFRNVKSSKYHRVTRDNMRVMLWPNGTIYFSTRQVDEADYLPKRNRSRPIL